MSVPVGKRRSLPDEMRAQRIHRLSEPDAELEPLIEERLPLPGLEPGQVLIRVRACGVCHTELDEIQGRTPPQRLPVTPGHQAVGEVVHAHESCVLDLVGRAVGVAWIWSSCRECRFCRSDLENLCPEFRGCGRDEDGGYAEYLRAPEDFVHLLPGGLDPIRAAPLLCAGAVGFRAIRLCGLEDGQPVGLTGFGASGHLVLQMLRHLYPASFTCVFARNPEERAFARELGADWTGHTTDEPPRPLTAIIDTTPAWKPVVAALQALEPGGRVVINAIAKEADDQSELAELDYQKHLWHEKILRTVTNVTRRDVQDCLDLAATTRLRPEIETLPLSRANEALRAVRAGGQRGAKVLVMD